MALALKVDHFRKGSKAEKHMFSAVHPITDITRVLCSAYERHAVLLRPTVWRTSKPSKSG
jgi:hypothetical protein